jgi:hypothetical protein
MAACTGVGTIIPGMSAYCQQFDDQGGITGDETGPVSRERRALRERVQR